MRQFTNTEEFPDPIVVTNLGYMNIVLSPNDDIASRSRSIGRSPTLFRSPSPSTLLMRRIVRDPRVKGGKPVVRGTRVTIEAILRRLAFNLNLEELLKEYE